MSNAIASVKPARRATRPAPTTPPAGPETSSVAGCAAASSIDATPPDDSITSGSRQARLARTVGERPQVSRRNRREIRVRGGRRGALVLAELRRDLVRRDDVHTGMPLAQLGRDRSLVRRVAKREQQTDRDRLDVADIGQRGEVERLQLAVRPEPPTHAVDRSSGTSGSGCCAHSRYRCARVWRRRCSRCSKPDIPDERRARTASFEQRVRRDGRPVHEPLDAAGADRTRRLEHRLLLAHRARHLRGAQPAAVEENGVRERPAHVDAQDRHARTLHRRGHPRIPLRLRRPDHRYRVPVPRRAGSGCTASTDTSCPRTSGASSSGRPGGRGARWTTSRTSSASRSSATR